tara:strand:- start:51 stop:416 length:366 start_codon:yes stop_codon:yes gene_type:complete
MACVEFGNTCFTAGDTITIDWTYTTDEGVAIDLTGATADMQLLESITDVSQFIDMTGGITDAVNGAGRFSLTNTQSQTLLPIITDGPATKSYVSKVRFTYADTTTQSVAGVNVDIEQSGIR